MSTNKEIEAQHKLKKHKLASIYDKSFQRFREDSRTHIQLQSLFGETICHRVVLMIYMFEDHMRGMKQHRMNIITPMIQRWYI